MDIEEWEKKLYGLNGNVPKVFGSVYGFKKECC